MTKMLKIYETLPVTKDITLTKEGLEIELRALPGYRINQIVVRTAWLDVTLSHRGKEERYEFALPASVFPERAKIRRIDGGHATVSAPRVVAVAHPCLLFQRGPRQKSSQRVPVSAL